MKKRYIAALMGGAAWGCYRWQPLRFQFAPLPPFNDKLSGGPEKAQLFRPGAKISIVAAHPDDAEFYLGGTLLQLGDIGANLHLIVATDGDKGYYPLARPERLRQIRRQEQRNAARQWQAREVIFLGHRDGRLRANETLIAQIEGELRRIEPEFVFLFESRYPPRLTHQDHLRAGEAALAALQRSGIGAWALRYSTLAPNFAIDVSEDWARRMVLLPFHGSQWRDRRLRLVSGIITRNAVTDGRRIGAPYAEGLRCSQMRETVIQ